MAIGIPSISSVLNRAKKAVYTAEGLALDVATVSTGIWGVLRSGMVVQGTGLWGKIVLGGGIAKYGFTCGRQVWYAAYAEPNRTAIIDDMGEITYRGLRDDAQALARVFQSKGIGKKGRVGVMARNSRVIPMVLAAKAYSGASIYLLNVASSPSQLQELIREHHLDAVFVDEEFGQHLPAEWNECEVFIAHAEDLQNPQGANPQWKSFQQLIDTAPSKKEEKLPFRPHQGSIVIMSSGTSGTPKGVRHREPQVPIPLISIIPRIGWKANLTVQQTASLFHSWGWANVNILIAHRCTVIFRRKFDPVQAMEDLQNYECQAIITSPIFIKEQLKVAQEGNYEVQPLEFIVSSGNVMHEDLVTGLVEEFGPVVRNFYGSTENSVATIADANDMVNNPATVGKPVAGVRLRILDENGKSLGPNQPGRIYCRGIMSMRNYTNDRDEMVEQRGLLEVGDRGYLDEEGRLYVLGRADDMIIVGGENVYPRSVEEVLFSMPGIRDLYAKGVDDDDTFQRIKLWVVRDDSPEGEALTEESIQQWVRENLLEPAVPRDVVFMVRLPRNPTGKVMPRELPVG